MRAGERNAPQACRLSSMINTSGLLDRNMGATASPEEGQVESAISWCERGRCHRPQESRVVSTLNFTSTEHCADIDGDSAAAPMHNCQRAVGQYTPGHVICRDCELTTVGYDSGEKCPLCRADRIQRLMGGAM